MHIYRKPIAEKSGWWSVACMKSEWKLWIIIWREMKRTLIMTYRRDLNHFSTSRYYGVTIRPRDISSINRTCSVLRCWHVPRLLFSSVWGSIIQLVSFLSQLHDIITIQTVKSDYLDVGCDWIGVAIIISTINEML